MEAEQEIKLLKECTTSTALDTQLNLAFCGIKDRYAPHTWKAGNVTTVRVDLEMVEDYQGAFGNSSPRKVVGNMYHDIKEK